MPKNPGILLLLYLCAFKSHAHENDLKSIVFYFSNVHCRYTFQFSGYFFDVVSFYLTGLSAGISEITILDIWNKCLFSDIRNCYFGYLKYLFRISKIIILDVKKLCKKGVLFEISKKYFGYQKQQFQISENKHLFRISKIVILDIRNSYLWYLEFFFRYLKLMCQYFRYHKFFFGYPE